MLAGRHDPSLGPLVLRCGEDGEGHRENIFLGDLRVSHDFLFQRVSIFRRYLAKHHPLATIVPHDPSDGFHFQRDMEDDFLTVSEERWEGSRWGQTYF